MDTTQATQRTSLLTVHVLDLPRAIEAFDPFAAAHDAPALGADPDVSAVIADDQNAVLSSGGAACRTSRRKHDRARKQALARERDRALAHDARRLQIGEIGERDLLLARVAAESLAFIAIHSRSIIVPVWAWEAR